MEVTLSACKYSVIIPTWNASQDLYHLLSALKNQSLSNLTEIIIIDSGSTDHSVETAKQFGANVIQIEPGEFNHGRTRNLGASISQGDFLFFFTQDAKPLHDDFCERMVTSLLTENAAGGFARQIARPHASPLVQRDLSHWIAGAEQRRVVRFDSMSDFCRLTPIDRYLSCVFDNVASVIRRDAWQRIPIPEAPYGEDVEWGMRAISNGYAIVYEPGARVEHSHDRPPSYTYKRTLIDHYRLQELFGVRTVPSRTAALKGWAGKTLRDWAWLLRRPSLKRSWARDMLQAPRHAWASNWGQYEGARRAAVGLPPAKQQGV